MTIRGKLTAMGAVVTLGFAAMAASSIVSIGDIRAIDRLAADGITLQRNFSELSSVGKDLLITSNLKAALEQWQAAGDKFAALHDRFEASPLLKAALKSAGKPALMEAFDAKWKTASQGVTEVAELAKGLVETYGANDAAVPGFLLGSSQFHDSTFASGTSVMKALISSNRGLSRGLDDLVAALSGVVEAKIARQVGFVLATGLAVALAVAVIFLLFASTMSRRLGTLGAAMTTLKERDFTVSIPVVGKDELAAIAAALNGFIGEFSSIIRGVKKISEESSGLEDEVGSAATQSAAAVTEMTASIVSISKRIRDFVDYLERSNGDVKSITLSIDSLAVRLEGQSASIARSTSAVEEMTASIRGAASIAERRENAAAELVRITKAGGEAIEETAASAQDIFHDLEKIAEVVAIIDGIAGMTNLLAMNAAIEAAHAGSAGRGFAVVAEEIRKLADATNANSKSIKETVEGISSKMGGVRERSERSRKAFIEVDREVHSTSEALVEISGTLAELSQGSVEIMDTMLDLTTLAASLRDETEAMRSHTDRVLEGLGKIEEVSLMVRDGIGEIEAGTNEVNAAMAHVNDLQAKSGESVQGVFREVSAFKTIEDIPLAEVPS